MANKIRISKSGAGSPTSVIPDFLGEVYINETNGDLWRANGASTGEWVLITDSSNLFVAE